jgi:hypothetical protein
MQQNILQQHKPTTLLTELADIEEEVLEQEDAMENPNDGDARMQGVTTIFVSLIIHF